MKNIFLFFFLFCNVNSFAQISGIPVAKPNKLKIVDLVNWFDSTNCNIKLVGSFQGTAEEYYVAEAFYCTIQKTAVYTVYYKNDFRYLKTWDVSNTKQLDSQLLSFKSIFPDSRQRLDYVKYISDSIQSVKDKEEEEKARLSELEQKKVLDSLIKVQDALLKYARDKNIVLVNWTWGYDNDYSSSVDFHVKIVNPYKQRIKYVSFTFSATNPVGDPAVDKFTGKRTVTLRGIGPVDYGDFGEWDFEDAFYSRTVENFKITVIKIQFFDGTVKVINNPMSLN